MAIEPIVEVLRRLSCRAEESDARLIEQFAVARDGDAFAVLVDRHGPMVLAVCRRVLRSEPDAEDAFQATFLVLARQARSVRNRASLGGWLYRVAFRLATRLRRQIEQRRGHEREGVAMPEPAAPAATPAFELHELLDAELERLPEKVRTALVLCYLEGKTNQEAARAMGCPPGSISAWLARGRDILRRRFARRGLAIAPAALLAALADARAAALTANLTHTAVQSAVRIASGQAMTGTAATLADGMIRSLFMTKLMTFAAVAGLLLAGLAVPLALTAGRDDPAREARKAEPPRQEDKKDAANGWKEKVIPPVEDLEKRTPFVQLSFTPDGKTLVGLTGARVVLWDAATGKQKTAVEPREKGGVFQFVGDRSKLLIAHERGVHLFDPEKQETLASFGWKLPKVKAQPGGIAPGVGGLPGVEAGETEVAVGALTLSRDGKRLAVGLSDGSVKLWDVAGFLDKGRAPEKEVHTFKGDKEGPIMQLAFSADGKRLAVGPLMGPVRVWDTVTHKQLASIERQGPGGEQPAMLLGLSFSPDGRALVTAADGEVILWEIATGKKLVGLDAGAKGAVFGGVSYEVGPDGKLKVTETIPEVMTRATFANDGALLAVGFNDGAVKLWDSAGLWQKAQAPKAPMAQFKARPRKQEEVIFPQVLAIALSPDGKRLAASTLDGAVRIWELPSAK